MVTVNVQFAVDIMRVPTMEQIIIWATSVFEVEASGELTIRVVGLEEARQLNATYRHRDSATNVLSFTAGWDLQDSITYYGDIAICGEIVHLEAHAQGKALLAHWAHMVIHGVLHLLGFDHQSKSDTAQMEAREIALLRQLGFDNPY